MCAALESRYRRECFGSVLLLRAFVRRAGRPARKPQRCALSWLGVLLKAEYQTQTHIPNLGAGLGDICWNTHRLFERKVLADLGKSRTVARNHVPLRLIVNLLSGGEGASFSLSYRV